MPACSGYPPGTTTEYVCFENCQCSTPLPPLAPDTFYAFVPCGKNTFLATTPIHNCPCSCQKTYAIDWRIPPLLLRGAQIFQLVDISNLYQDVMAENRLLKTERFELLGQVVKMQKKITAIETLFHGLSEDREETEGWLEKAFEQLKQDDEEEGEYECNDDSLPVYVSDDTDDMRPSTSGVTFQKKNKKRKKKNKSKK